MTNTNITMKTQVSRNPEITFTRVDQEVVMVNLEKGEYYGLDEIASEIWELVEQPVSVDQLCNTLSEHYQVDPQRIRQDVLPFLQQLAEYDAILLS